MEGCKLIEVVGDRGGRSQAVIVRLANNKRVPILENILDDESAFNGQDKIAKPE